MKQRRDMPVGEMFVCERPIGVSYPLAWPWPEVWVVLDAHTEIGFWSGAKTRIGEVAPSLRFEVIAFSNTLPAPGQGPCASCGHGSLIHGVRCCHYHYGDPGEETDAGGVCACTGYVRRAA